MEKHTKSFRFGKKKKKWQSKSEFRVQKPRKIQKKSTCGRRDNENPGSIGLKNGLFKEIAKGSVRLVEAQEPKIEKLNLGSG